MKEEAKEDGQIFSDRSKVLFEDLKQTFRKNSYIEKLYLKRLTFILAINAETGAFIFSLLIKFLMYIFSQLVATKVALRFLIRMSVTILVQVTTLTR